MHKIVVIENDQQIATLLSYTLTGSGYHVVCLTSPDAMKAFRAGRIHADVEFIVSDVMMPCAGLYTKKQTHDGTYTGLLLAIDLRKRYPDVPIVFWSGFPVKDLRRVTRCLSIKLQRSGLLAKPSGVGEMLEMVEHYFRTGRLKEGLVQRVWTALVVRPSFCGIGLDLKKLLNEKR